MSKSKLQRINITRFKKRLGEAGEAYLAVLFFLKHNFLKANSLQALSKIHPPHVDLVQNLIGEIENAKKRKNIFSQGLF